MSITKKSDELIQFFTKYQCIPFVKPNKNTKIIFKKLYKEIMTSDKLIQKYKKQLGVRFHNPTIEKIHSVSDIPRPETASFQGIPSKIVKYILSESVVKVSYYFSLFDKKIEIHFVDETFAPEKYNSFVDRILVWLGFIIPHTSKECSKDLTIFVYLMDLEKKIPDNRMQILDQIHVNTAYTYSCKRKNEIVIYRKEEWFKVLLHETFHNLGLDFSNMNNSECHRMIHKMFPLKSEVNLFEAYAECWAEILNVLFVSFFTLKNRGDEKEFLSTSFSLIYLEQCFSIFQMVKLLQFMGLRYENLYSRDEQSRIVRENLYRENTNVFSYYIITTLLLSHYEEFIGWCDKEHTSLFAFKKTLLHQKKFCGFIQSYYKSIEFLSDIHCVEESIEKIKRYNGKERDFLMNTLRMSISELK